jgi:hypothetical protein
MTSKLVDAKVNIADKLRGYRRLEYRKPRYSTVGNPLGAEYIGVDFDRGSYRARIGVSRCFDGAFYLLLLGRFSDKDSAALCYREAHAFLYGADSWTRD